MNRIDIFPGVKTYFLVALGIIATLVSVDGGAVAINELTPERIQTVLELLGLGTLRLAVGRN